MLQTVISTIVVDRVELWLLHSWWLAVHN